MGIEFTEYDSMSDLLLYLNDDLTLNFVVKFSRRSKSGERIFYQYETKNGTDKYGSPSRSIKRSMNFYFVIQSKSSFGDGVVLRPQDVEMLNQVLQFKVLPWFFDDSKAAFRIKDDNLILNGVEPVTYYQSESNRWIQFEPILVYYDSKAGRGIRVTLYSGQYADMGIDSFMGFIALLKTDMYAAANAMCNYAKMEPHGVNIYSGGSGLGATPVRFAKNSFLDNTKVKE